MSVGVDATRQRLCSKRDGNLGRGQDDQERGVSPKRKRRRASMEATEPPESSWAPADGMAQFRQQQKIDRSFRSRYVEGLSFTPDHFQIQAMDALEAGHSVLVAAPTGAGKTVVGEFAVALSLSTGSRALIGVV